ncbi:MAG: hypothetical protein UR61_C0015G0005 [candidate division WS6 bacterium GW2011_GWE1_34_7]|uniref:Fibronectin type-III domain-containing protein n=1 Tax=candidate division WS6 bacterium GW2011_GWE1_34_7 TaxID=1619093 RepID=A0A0G0B8F3_9BACT|nr:MAG: hypothetical protein UR61_C0015G0005 [candidate division WS6 bacterium GW2011_GWE1_34_7]
MHLTPYQKKQIRFVLVLLLGIPATVFAVYKGIQYISQATGDSTPQQVIVSNVTTKSLTLSWTTQKEVEGYVVPILDGVELSPVSDKRGEGLRNNHYVELKSLEPDTEYSFTLISDGEEFTSSSGEPYKFKTAPFGTETTVPNPVLGTVEGSSVEDVIVYVLFANKSVYPVSTIVPSSGNWIVDLSAFRSVEDKELIKTTDETELILIGRDSLAEGYVEEGTYSALFDSNGKLKDIYTFEIGDLPNLLSYFPASSILGSIEEIVEPSGDDDQEEEEEEPTIPEENPPNDEPVLPPPSTSTYTIKHDIVWLDLTSNSSSLSLDSGEDTILVTNITDVGFSVVWRSPNNEEGYIKYGLSKTSLTNEGRDYRDGFSSLGSYSSHLIESERVEPETTYYFEIYSGDTVYDNGGEKYSVTTLSTLATPPPFETKSGQILNSTNPSDLVIVFKLIDNNELETLGSSGYISTIPDEVGEWTVIVGDARSEDGDSYFSFSNSDILQTFLLGAESKKFDFTLAQEDIELDILDIGEISPTDRVKLLSDYGIINLR